ncbi:hypothetical protein ACRN97_10685 [Shewanella baltica]|uniref:hypothetical protein n=1 Tax=Shewanella baltica TaxID=62322 RepID=UPI003D7BE119
MKYEQRVVAFIDILGFKSLLNETVDSKGNDQEEKIDTVISAYEAIRDIWDLDEKSELYDTKSIDTKKVSIFSDCIVVSFKVEQKSEVFFTLLEIKWLIMRLLSRGILCRGGVSLGKFIHSDNYLFGPALVEAHTLESKAAMYPRVILDTNVIDAGTENRTLEHTSSDEMGYVYSLLERDSDGMYYIDYFSKAQEELDDPEYGFAEYIANLGDIIRKGLMASSHHTKVDLRVKYSWMRERYNRMVTQISENNYAEKLRNSGDVELSEFYEKLKPISPRKYNKELKHN